MTGICWCTHSLPCAALSSSIYLSVNLLLSGTLMCGCVKLSHETALEGIVGDCSLYWRCLYHSGQIPVYWWIYIEPGREAGHSPANPVQGTRGDTWRCSQHFSLSLYNSVTWLYFSRFLCYIGMAINSKAFDNSLFEALIYVCYYSFE